jgi:hypothetical protein
MIQNCRILNEGGFHIPFLQLWQKKYTVKATIQHPWVPCMILPIFSYHRVPVREACIFCYTQDVSIVNGVAL